MCSESLARLSRRVWRRFVRSSREISLASSLHRASTNALINTAGEGVPQMCLYTQSCPYFKRYQVSGCYTSRVTIISSPHVSPLEITTNIALIHPQTPLSAVGKVQAAKGSMGAGITVFIHTSYVYEELRRHPMKNAYRASAHTYPCTRNSGAIR